MKPAQAPSVTRKTPRITKKLVAPLALVFFTFSACAQPAPATDPNLPETPPPPMRAIVAVIHGNSSPNESVRRIGHNIPAKGYLGFYYEFFPPLRAMGYRRFAVWNPFGVNAGEDMDADQAVEMQELLDGPHSHWRYRKVMSPEAWTNAATTYITKHGDELIAYNGTIDQDPDFLALRDDPDAWHARAQASYAPYVAAGASVAFDASQDIRPGTIEHGWIESLREQGVKTYIETYWLRDNPWTHELPCIVRDDFYRHAIVNHPRGFTEAGWALMPDNVQAEVCRLVGNVPGETIAQRRQRIREIVADGHTPILGPADAAWYAREVGW